MEIIIFTDINNTYGFGRDPGAYRIATELRLNGFTVQVIDLFASLTLDNIEEIADKFIDNDSLMVAFSTTHFASNNQIVGDLIETFVERTMVYGNCDCFPQTDDWIEKLQSIFLKKNPNIKFVVGGEKTATAKRERYKMDYWIMGQADQSIVDLTNAIKHNRPFSTSIHSNRDYEYKYFNTCKITWTERDLLFPNEHIPIEVARGCSFNCPFCSYRKKSKYDFVKDVNVMRDELMYNYEMFGITSYMVMDPTFNDSIEKVDNFCNLFASMPFQMEWSGFARLGMFSRYPEMREMFLESGVKSVQFGIETLNDQTIKIIRKGESSSKTKQILHFLNEKWDKEIITGSFFIIGLPEETEEDFYHNIEWLLRDECPLHSVDFGILTIRNYIDDLKEEVAFSSFSRDTNKYDYDKSGAWINEKTGLTRKRCFEILHDISMDNMNRKTIDFYYYSRMRNLGYTFDELWSLRKDYGETFVESNIIRDKMKDVYIDRLMNL